MNIRKLIGAASLIAITLTHAAPAAAQSADDFGFELLQLMVDEGLIPREKAQKLLDKARANALAHQKDAAAASQPSVDINYVPEAVRTEMKAELKKEMADEGREKGWLAPGLLPEWVKGISISGDFRARFQRDGFDKDNFPFFPDTQAINVAGGATDALGYPLLNSTVNRNRALFRARLNVAAQVSDKVKVGFGIAAGQERGAISTGALMGDFYDQRGLWVMPRVW